MSPKTKNILSYFVSFLMFVILVAPTFALAIVEGGNNGSGEGNNNTGTSIVIKNPFKLDTIQGLIQTVVNDILIPIGSVVAVLMIMWAGFLYVTAGGNPAQISKAHQALLWAVIGAAILLGAKVISDAITVTIGQLKT